MENIEGCAYQQLWSWSDCSYKELAKTRDALGDSDLANSFNERLKDIDEAVKALNGVEKLIREFDMDMIYALDSDASYVLAKQIVVRGTAKGQVRKAYVETRQTTKGLPWTTEVLVLETK